MADGLARLTLVSTELEAEEICGLLRTEGIVCFQRPTDPGVVWMPGIAAGYREILVAARDLPGARELLEATPEADDDSS
jgi:hypothetical protein